MKLFRNNRVLRFLRPAATALALFAAVWHAAHAFSNWQQMQEWKTSDPALSNFFWGAFQTEVGVTLASFVAGIFAWHLFKPRVEPQS